MKVLRPCSALLCALPLALAVLFAGCSQPRPIEGFDSQAWKNDPNGCKGERAALWSAFRSRKMELKGYKENDLPWLLGPAEAQELLEKGQKTYSYYLSGSKRCSTQPAQPVHIVLVRVNATSRVSEVQEITR